MGSLALLYDQMGESDQAEELYNDVLSKKEKIRGAKHPDTLLTKQNFAVFLRDRFNNPKKAILLLEEILVVRRKQNNQKDLSSTLTALGTSLGKCKIYDNAISCLLESIDIRRTYANTNSLISSLNRLADIYDQTGDKNKAIDVRIEIKGLTKNNKELN